MKLVHAEEQDKNIVNELYISVRNTPFCVWDEYYPTMEEIDNDLNANTLYIIKENDMVLGAVSVNPINEMDEISQFTKTSNPCEIARVVVNKNYQSKKIGEFMIKEIIKELKNKSFDSIRLAVEINHIPAIKLYEKCGFNRIGEHFMYEHHYYLYELLF